MRSLPLFLLVVVSACGSVDADPETCQNGLCVDSRFPFCDADGQIGGTPGACIAISCTPGDVEMCRGDVAVTCNTAGDNYDLVSCPNGCDAQGCIPPPEEVDCTTNDQCTNPAPICSTEMTCRGCQSDAECTSTVCDVATGACVAEAAIIYSAAGGSTTSNCTLSDPCTIERAIAQATSGVGGRILRMLPGAAYATDIAIRGNTILPIVATGASASAKLIVQNGASVEVRDLTLTSTASNVTCGDNTVGAPVSTLLLRNISGSNLAVNKCNLRVLGGAVGALSTNSDAAVEVDRAKLTFAFSTISGERVQVSIKNSVIAGSISLGTSDPTGTAGSKLSVAFNTFVMPSGNAQACDVAGQSFVRSEVFENNVFYSLGGTSDVVLPRRCTFTNNIMFPQGTAINNNTRVDPQLVDASGGDYHLKATSPAINAAIPSSGLGTDHDFDGVARPQGAALDIGAFERP